MNSLSPFLWSDYVEDYKPNKYGMQQRGKTKEIQVTRIAHSLIVACGLQSKASKYHTTA